MNLAQAVLQLDAAAETSRLRLLVALLGGETTVGDLVAVLEQSQPRVSRHLRLLVEAGLVESFREGRSIYYRWSAPGLAAGVVRPVSAVAASDDPTLSLTGRGCRRCPASGSVMRCAGRCVPDGRGVCTLPTPAPRSANYCTRCPATTRPAMP
jgi:DNA-binding transcriptional ArsR family regulator